MSDFSGETADEFVGRAIFGVRDSINELKDALIEIADRKPDPVCIPCQRAGELVTVGYEVHMAWLLSFPTTVRIEIAKKLLQGTGEEVRR